MSGIDLYILGSILGLGYYLNRDGKKERVEVKEIRKVPKNQLNNQQDIYNSNMVETVKKDELKRASELHDKARDPNSNIIYKDVRTNKQMTHNNMVPFFGSTSTQNVDLNRPNRNLETFTGQALSGTVGEFYKEKREMKQDNFADTEKEYTNGGPIYDYDLTRYSDSLKVQSNVLPFQQLKVAKGLNSKRKYGTEGKDGFHETYRPKQYTVDELRVKSNPKVSYSEPATAPKHFVTNRGNVGKVGKNKVFTYFENKGLIGQMPTGDVRKTTNKEGFDVPVTSREITSSYQIGNSGTTKGVGRHQNYLQDDVKYTKKDTTKVIDYYGDAYYKKGNGYATNDHQSVYTNRDETSREHYTPAGPTDSSKQISYGSFYNAEINALKESTLERRAPTKVSSMLMSGKEFVNQTTKRVQFDIFDKNREQIPTKTYEMGTNRPKLTGIGAEYTMLDRIDESAVSQLKENPYSQGVNAYTDMNKRIK